MLEKLDDLAAAMSAEATRLDVSAGGAGRIAEHHFERMLQKARSLALGELTPAELSGARRDLYKIAGEMRWDLAGIGNNRSWAFGEIVQVLRASERAINPLLALAGVRAPGAVDADALAAAFQNLDATFAQASVDAAQVVQGELTRLVTAGVTSKDIAKRLVASELLDPVANMTVEQRATTIARTETMRVYRQAVRQKAQRAGLDHFRMVGPVTPKTSKICRSFVGRVMPAADWRLVMGSRWEGGEHENRGFHPNCRHSWQPVKPQWLGKEEGDVSRSGAFDTQIAREHDADESLPAYSLRDLRGMPDSERRELLGRSDNGIRLVA